MDQPFNAILDACEGAKGGNLGDDTGDDLTGGVALLDRRPGINLCTFDRESDFLFLFVNAENLDFDLLADVQDFAGMIDATPGELADMDQSVCPSQVNEGAEIRQVTDDTFAHLAGFEFIEQFFAATLAPFLDSESLGEDQAIARPVDLDNFELQFFVFHALQFGCSFLVFSP